MSKLFCTDVKVGKPLQVEHKMKVNDLVSLLMQSRYRYIASNLIEIFPDVKVVFVLMKEGSTDAFYLFLGTKSKEGEALCSSSFAGKVEVDIDGVSQIGTLGNVEKNEYVQFKSAADYF